MSKIGMRCLALVVFAVVGCGEVQRAELEKKKAELDQARAELAAAQAELEATRANARASYLDELERLEALRQKGVLTEEEFAAKKKAALAARAPAPAPASRTPAGAWKVDELARELRLLQSLFSNNTVTSTELSRKKASLIQKPLVLTDLRRDLETFQALFNENVITSNELTTLKTKILEIDSGPSRKK